MSSESWLFLFAGLSGVGGLATMAQLWLQLRATDAKKSITVSKTRLRSLTGLLAASLILSAAGLYYSVGPRDIPEESPENNLVFEYGRALDMSPEYSKIVVNGDRFYPYRDSYKLAAVCFVWDGLSDYLDVPRIQTSAAYDIRKGSITTLIRFDPSFLQYLRERQVHRLSFALLMLPIGVSPGAFTTLRQAKAMGARRVWVGQAVTP